MMNKKSFRVLFSFVALSFFHVAFAEEAAKVNGKIISSEQVNQRVIELAKTSAEFVGRKAALEDLIKREVAIQEARRMKLDQDPSVVERMNNVLYYSLIEKKLGAEFDRVTLSDAEAKAWYEKNPEVRTSQIFISLPQNIKPEDEKKAVERLNTILNNIRAGKTTFSEAAQQNSEDASASVGGDMDYRMKDRIDPVYYRAAVRLGKPGDISGPVRSAVGVHLIRLTARHSWIEVDRARVKRLIADEKRQNVTDQYLNGLRQKATVSVNKAFQ